MRHAELPYAELQVTTNYSFLRSGSHPKELVERADGTLATTDGRPLKQEAGDADDD